jgi:uncharacterized protein YlxW (UPF0749 family)
MAFKIHSLNSFILAFIGAGIFIGILVTAQFKSAVTANSYLIDERNAQKELFKSFDNDRNGLKAKILALRTQIETNQESLKITSENTRLELLDELKKELGLATLKGEGLEITMAEGKESSTGDNASLIHAADLRDIVNLLRTGKAEGISINDQRVIASTPINAVGNTILVNNAHVIGPFKIIVVGDPEILLERIKDEKAYPDLYRRINLKKIEFNLQKMTNLTLPVYDGEFFLRYTKKTASS